MRRVILWHAVAFVEAVAMFSFYARSIEGDGVLRWVFLGLAAAMYLCLWESIPKARGFGNGTVRETPGGVFTVADHKR